jgi:hypothetical protein
MLFMASTVENIHQARASVAVAEKVGKKYKKTLLKTKVLPRFELGLLDSESNVLTTRP